MNRLRLASVAALAGLGLVCGCSNVGNGQLLNRLGLRPRCSDCEVVGVGPGGCCEGPVVGDPGGPVLPAPALPAGPPIGAAPEGGLPPLNPPPNRLVPEAQPRPADPTAKAK
jgi:hypothetical protein